MSAWGDCEKHPQSEVEKAMVDQRRVELLIAAARAIRAYMDFCVINGPGKSEVSPEASDFARDFLKSLRVEPECACGTDRTGVSMYCQCCNMLTTLPHSHPELSPIRCPSLTT